MQGIFIATVGKSPKSKAEIKRTVAADPALVSVYATSAFGNEWEGTLDTLPEGVRITFVGPDPYTSRRFYGNIEKRNGKVVVS